MHHKLRPVFFLLLLNLVSFGEAQAFERVVTLAPVLSEWTAALLGEEKAKKQIVGVSEYSQYPSFLKNVESIGPYPRLNIEKIAALKPDLILASSEYNLPEQIEQLKRLHLPVKILPKEKFSSMSEWILNLGAVLQEPNSAQVEQRKWEAGVNSLLLRQKSRSFAKKRIFLEIQHLPLITVGGESFLNEAFNLMGEQNVFQDLKQAYPKVSKEAVLKKNPDVIYILTLMGQGVILKKPSPIGKGSRVFRR